VSENDTSNLPSEEEVCRLVEENMEAVDMALNKLLPLPPFVDRNDLKSAGYLALWDAAKECNDEETFRGFAFQRITWRMIDVLRIINNRWDSKLISLEEEVSEGVRLEGCIPDTSDGRSSLCVVGDGGNVDIGRILSALPSFQKNILYMRYLEGYIYTEIAEALGFGDRPLGTQKNQVWRLKHEALEAARGLTDFSLEKGRHMVGVGERIEDTGLSKKSVAQLGVIGIHTLEDLERVSSKKLRKTFHHKTVGALARRMIEKGLSFKDGEKATGKVAELGKPRPIIDLVEEKQEPTSLVEHVPEKQERVPQNDSVLDLAATGLTSLVNGLVTGDNASIGRVKTIVSMSVGDRDYELELSLKEV